MLLAITNGQKNNFSNGFELKPIITYYLKFVVKVLWKCCENIVDVTLLIYYSFVSIYYGQKNHLDHKIHLLNKFMSHH